MAASLQVPLILSTHQEGHLMAALYQYKEQLPDPFLFVYLYSGTTESIRVDQKALNHFQKEIIGKTLDISAGQVIDRIGVLLRFSFPAGKELESLAKKGEHPYPFKISVKETNLHFSGLETQAARALENGVLPEEVALGIFEGIRKSLAKAIINAKEKETLVVFAGGVMSNSFLRETLRKDLREEGFYCHFAEPALAGDNAVGIAMICRNQCMGGVL